MEREHNQTAGRYLPNTDTLFYFPQLMVVTRCSPSGLTVLRPVEGGPRSGRVPAPTPPLPTGEATVPGTGQTLKQSLVTRSCVQVS